MAFWRQYLFLAPVAGAKNAVLAPKHQNLAPKIGHLGSWPFYRRLAPIGAFWRQLAIANFVQPPNFGGDWRYRQLALDTCDKKGDSYRQLAPIGANRNLGANLAPNWRQCIWRQFSWRQCIWRQCILKISKQPIRARYLVHVTGYQIHWRQIHWRQLNWRQIHWRQIGAKITIGANWR